MESDRQNTANSNLISGNQVTAQLQEQDHIWKTSKFSYAWATVGILLAALCFWLIRGYLDKGQASLLFLPVVIACAVRFGFGTAVWAAAISFLCWDFCFLPPQYTLAVNDPKDWLSLVVFLVAAIVTAQLAANARQQTREALDREDEIMTIYHASEAVAREVQVDRLLPTLSDQLGKLCGADQCAIYAVDASGLLSRRIDNESPATEETIAAEWLANAAFKHGQVIGFGEGDELWYKAAEASNPELIRSSVSSAGIFIPLHTDDRLVGVLHVGSRRDNVAYSPRERRLMMTIANQIAVVIARERLIAEASETNALRQADSLKDSLLSMVSHELRSPLASIKATASGLLQPGVLESLDGVRKAATSIDSEADRLTKVVSNLLDLSRLGAGSWTPAYDWCDIGEIVSTALDRLPPHQADRVAVDLSPDIPLVSADYVQIALLLTNLLENAIKYGDPDKPIQLSAHINENEFGQFIIVAVRDFGLGFAPRDIDHVFERFYRGERDRQSTVHGVGLGLALCAAIAEAHGATIKAGNAPVGSGGGAIVSVKLPIRKVETKYA